VEEELEGRRDVSSQHQRSKSRPLENLESAELRLKKRRKRRGCTIAMDWVESDA
jgi:hypothetical protein